MASVTLTLTYIESTVSLLGILLNAISLSYFLRFERTGLSNQMIIFLNCLDLVALIVNIVFLTMHYFFDYKTRSTRLLYYIFYNYFLISTGIVTSILSVVRTINIRCPFYHIRTRFMWLGTWAILITFLITLERVFVTYYFSIHYIVLSMVLVATLVLVTAISSGISISSLRRRRRRSLRSQNCTTSRGCRIRYRASFTIIILAIVFCISNTVGFIGQAVILLRKYYGGRKNLISDEEGHFILWGLSFFCITNSIVNPCVYMIRKRDLRRYMKKGSGRIAKTISDALLIP